MSDRFYHPAALVESDQIGDGTRVWAFAHVMTGARVGSNCNLGNHTFVESGATIGNNVTLKNNVCVWLGVRLEDDTFIGPNVAFTNDRVPRSPRMPQVRERYERIERWMLPTIVERGASIGANATILPGIRLGRYCMVAAGALVTANVPPFALVIGSPARQVADLCRCGQKLDDSYQIAVCEHCGETPEMRCHLSPMEPVAL
jgi:UDP-2-acetamido-3-amino-2,3-dideoxy-glucuronate N-acetyltransferase